MKSDIRKFAAIMILVIMASVFILHLTNSGSIPADNQNNIELYAGTESISMFEDESAQGDNSHIFKSSSNFMFSMFRAYILINVCLSASIFKHKYATVISDICRLFSYSVFVVFYANKSDGKKRMILNS
jgi:hypothetical protein